MAEKNYMSESDQRVLDYALRRGDFGWEERAEPEKRVVLTNPESLEGVGIMSYVKAFRGTGHVEWEFIMATWMIDAVGKALETGDECDITVVFNTEFLAAPKRKGDDYRRLSKEQVYEHLIKLFTIQEESEDMIKVAINVE